MRAMHIITNTNRIVVIFPNNYLNKNYNTLLIVIAYERQFIFYWDYI